MDQDRDVILDTLRRVQKRVRFNRGIQELALTSCLALVAFLTFQLLRLLVAIPASFDTTLAPAMILVGSGILFAWRMTRRRTLAQAAALADGKGDLKDELKTAFWFIDNAPERVARPWIELQARRAATTAAALDLARIVPTDVPKRLFLFDGVLLVIGFYLGTLPSPPSMISPERVLELTRAEEMQVQDIHDLLTDAGDTERPGILEELDETLDGLEQGELHLADGLEDLSNLENLLSEGNLELNTMKEGLGELAQNLRSSSDLTPVADAMESADLDQASELLRALAENLPNVPADMAELSKALENASQTEDASLEELLENLKQAAEALARQDGDEAQRSLEEAANELESMGRKMEAQRQMNEARRQLGELRKSLGQQSPFGGSDGEAPPSDSEEGEPQSTEAGGMPMPGGDVQLQMGGSTAPDPTDVLDAGPGGHSTGPSQGEDNIPGEPTRLEVQLEMELLAAEEAPERKSPDDLFDKESRQEESLVDYREVAPRSEYADEAVLNEERIPWRYRELVKNYFLSLGSPEAEPEDDN